MEFWDALEDSQYLEAMASVQDGPRPICQWEIPNQAQLNEWEQQQQRQRHQPLQQQQQPLAEPLSLEWYLANPIGLYFFSTFIKEQHPIKTKQMQGNNSNTTTTTTTTSTLLSTDKSNQTYAAAIRMNFIEDLQRFINLQSMDKNTSKNTNITTSSTSSTETIVNRKRLRAKRLLRYVSDNSVLEMDEFLQSYNRTSSPQPIQLTQQSTTTIPALTLIREYELQLSSTTIQSRLQCQTNAQVQELVQHNFDSTYQSNVVGLCGTMLQQFFDCLLLLQQPPQQKQQRQNEKDQSHVKEKTNNIEPHRNNHNLDSTISVPLDHHHHHPLHPHPHFIVEQVQALICYTLIQEFQIRFQSSHYFKRTRQFVWYCYGRHVVYTDFDVVTRILGRGGLGTVRACRMKTTGTLYALKSMTKKRVKMKHSGLSVVNEQKALQAVTDCPFIINLKYSFQTVQELYLVLDLMSGGDLGYHLSQRKKFGHSSLQSLYYGARILLGLQALHDKGYVYRDLKPENCLLSDDGRVKLSDLGLATKYVPQLPAGIVGTRGYWAPEMHKRDTSTGKRLCYNQTVDWFSFGCCMAEFMSGKNLFRSTVAVRFGRERGEPERVRLLVVVVVILCHRFDCVDLFFVLVGCVECNY